MDALVCVLFSYLNILKMYFNYSIKRYVMLFDIFH